MVGLVDLVGLVGLVGLVDLVHRGEKGEKGAKAGNDPALTPLILTPLILTPLILTPLIQLPAFAGIQVANLVCDIQLGPQLPCPSTFQSSSYTLPSEARAKSSRNSAKAISSACNSCQSSGKG